MTNADCPIPNTHNRLKQAHYLWHQALNSYEDPDGFRANLNALVEALRNVTFMLQKEKSNIPDFDVWYEGWRDRMKADDVMAWLAEARTTVVHKSDLKTDSVAIAKVHNYLDVLTLEKRFPPLMPTPVICSMLSRTVPKELKDSRQYLVLSVERRWTVRTLPNHEVLDSLAHAYGVLAGIVREAHERIGSSYLVVDHQGTPVEGQRDRLPCMVTTREQRTVRMSLSDGRPLVHRERMLRKDDASDEAAAHRYGMKEVPALPSDDPFTFAEALVPMALDVLKKDRYHIRLFHLRTPNGWQLRQLVADSREAKFGLMQSLAETVAQYKVDAIVEIAEAWVAPLSELRKGRMPDQARKRQEVLVVSVATADGAYRAHTTVFTRGFFGRIKFQKTVVEDSALPMYMAPICDVWGLPRPESIDPDAV